VVLGELLAGVLLGPTLAGYLDPHDRTFTFLADIGFALVMFVAGAHVPVRDRRLRSGLGAGALRAAAVAGLALLPAWALARAFHTGHTALYTVLFASSSAAVILPALDSLRLGDAAVLQLLPQVAVADTACSIALPLVIDPAHAGRAALGALAVVGCAFAAFLILRQVEQRGWRRRVHRLSQARGFALELRFSLALLFALAALAVATHVSIMLAGFTLGLAVAGVGEPRRLAKQLFALTEGFLGPLFFLWLGASLNLRQLGRHPADLLLGALLGLAALAVHAAMRLTGQPLRAGVVAAAQMGIPVSAAALGTQSHLLDDAEAAALMLGAVITLGALALTAAVGGRSDEAPH
jgi:Kef-type K+ transport system membrane component KefB